MQSMSRSAPLPANQADVSEGGLPRVSYYTPLITTLVACVVLFLFAAVLALTGLFNTITQWGRASNNEEGGSYLGAGLCGVLTIVAAIIMAYFGVAMVKGIRDMRQQLYYTRGTVVKRHTPAGRRADNWLMIQPAYVGPELNAATRTTDEQEVTSVDRSEIFRPRFTGDSSQEWAKRQAAEQAAQAAPTSTGSYLSPGRISAPKDPVPFGPDEGEDDGKLPGPRVVYRIDFASKAGLAPDDEVIVAHSRYLQHIFYVARLRNGSWEPYINKNLI